MWLPIMVRKKVPLIRRFTLNSRTGKKYLTGCSKRNRWLNKKTLSLNLKAVTSEQKDSISTEKNWKSGEKASPRTPTLTGTRFVRLLA
jgi:hypothetical protein